MTIEGDHISAIELMGVNWIFDMAVSRLFCNANCRTASLGVAPVALFNFGPSLIIPPEIYQHFLNLTVSKTAPKKIDIFKVRLCFYTFGHKSITMGSYRAKTDQNIRTQL